MISLPSDDTDPPTCDNCGATITGQPISDDAGRDFCSSGCSDIVARLGTAGDESPESPPDRSAAESAAHSPEPGTIADHEETFLQVEGMYSTTCEAFLESVAERQPGVTAAAASYVAETIRITYDPEETSIATLCDALSKLGYTATPRDDDAKGTTKQGFTEDHPKHDGPGMEDLLGYRYAAGIIFGSFMLLPYVIFLYPAYANMLLNPGSTPELGPGGVLILPLFLVLTGVVLFFTGLPVLRGAYISLRMRRPTTDLLVAITVVSGYVFGTVAFALGRIDAYYDLTIVVAGGVVAAMFYESLVKRRAMERLTDLTVSQVTEARRYDDGTTESVTIEDLSPDDRVLVREGERIPVDGILDQGSCVVDEAVVTGESLPVQKDEGDPLVAGSVVTADAAIVRVDDDVTSNINQLTTSVWDIQSATHGVHRRADELAGVAVPAVVGISVLAGGATLLLGNGLPAAALAVLSALIVVCPWALGLSTPLSVATSVEAALERGLVVFDETIFERLRDVDVVVFDKTGTLTTGDMDVVDVDAPDELLADAVSLERRAAHPAANAIVSAFDVSGKSVDPATDGGVVDDTAEPDGRISEFHSHDTGVEGVVDGRTVLVGNRTLFEEQGWTVPDGLLTRAETARRSGQLPVLIGRDGAAEGLVVVGDQPRDGWAETIDILSERGVDIVVLTGDDGAATDRFEDHNGVDTVFADVSPGGKTAAIRRLQRDDYVAMVGDGTNDAPALAAADLGIALDSGTDLAADAADLAVLDDDIAAVETAFDVAAAAQTRLRQNTGLAFVYNGIAISAALVGLMNPIVAIAAAVTTGGLISANSLRKLGRD